MVSQHTCFSDTLSPILSVRVWWISRMQAWVSTAIILTLPYGAPCTAVVIHSLVLAAADSLLLLYLHLFRKNYTMKLKVCNSCFLKIVSFTQWFWDKPHSFFLASSRPYIWTSILYSFSHWKEVHFLTLNCITVNFYRIVVWRWCRGG